jgi:hypothetical protein
MYGFSTGRAPIQVSINIKDTKDQNMILFAGRNATDLLNSDFIEGIK